MIPFSLRADCWNIWAFPFARPSKGINSVKYRRLTLENSVSNLTHLIVFNSSGHGLVPKALAPRMAQGSRAVLRKRRTFHFSGRGSLGAAPEAMFWHSESFAMHGTGA